MQNQLKDRNGHPIIVIEQGRSLAVRAPAEVARREHAKLAHGQPGHICYRVYPWQREFWGAGVHTGAHDCPDGGCR